VITEPCLLECDVETRACACMVEPGPILQRTTPLAWFLRRLSPSVARAPSETMVLRAPNGRQ
jgi:hypothetical protein